MPRAFTDRERDRIVAALRAAAAEAMHGVGLRRTPVSALCRAAGISKGAFYSFFDNKEALAVAVLREAEASLRTQLLEAASGPAPLQRVLTILFTEAPRHPQLALLTRPPELEWLLRGLPEGALAQAQADDERWHAALYQQLVERGVARADGAEAFVGLPGAAMALAQGDALVGPHADAVRTLMMEALQARLAVAEPDDRRRAPYSG